MSDAERAIELGLNHICFYNLVCYKGLGTAWSEDDEIMSTLPTQHQGFENWLALYHYLETQDYFPITVTDFGNSHRMDESIYQYEQCLRTPEQYDWIGFGPAAISSLYNLNFTRGIKFTNYSSMEQYIRAVNENRFGWEKAFQYEPQDLRIFWLTRQIKGTSINTEKYFSHFQSDLLLDWSIWLLLMADNGLMIKEKETWKLTPKGMFYVDSMAGFLAVERVNFLNERSYRRELREERFRNFKAIKPQEKESRQD